MRYEQDKVNDLKDSQKIKSLKKTSYVRPKSEKQIKKMFGKKRLTCGEKF